MTSQHSIDEQQIFAIERPSPKLFTYYCLSSLLLGPLFFIPLLPLYFRYHTLRYRFDAQGISMRWGILFRVGLALVLLVGFTYTSLALWSKTGGFKPAQGFTLDGTAYLESQAPDDAAAARWL